MSAVVHRAETDPWTVDRRDPDNPRPYAGAFPSRHDYVAWLGGDLMSFVPVHARGWRLMSEAVGALVALAFDPGLVGSFPLRALRRIRDDAKAGAR